MPTQQATNPPGQNTPPEAICHPHPEAVFSVPTRLRQRWRGILVRPATPADTPFLALSLQESARSHRDQGLWDFVFPGQEAARLRMLEDILMLGEGHFCHHSGFLVAQKDNQLLACASSYDPCKNSPEAFSALLLRHLMQQGFSQEEVFSLVMRVAPFFRCLPETGPRTMVAEWASTLPAFRSQGLIFLLVEHLIHRARQQRYHFFQASHYEGNRTVQRCLEKAGFQYISRAESPRLLQLTGTGAMHRYLLEIG